MRYLRLSADYLEPSLVDPQAGRSTAAELGLFEALSQRIEDWNEQYQHIIALTMPERAAEEIRSLIASLDSEGLELARDIVAETPGGAKVEYFSEGLLKLVVGVRQNAPRVDLIREFVAVECDDYTRELLLALISQTGPCAVRTVTLNSFNVVIDGSDRFVTVEDELDPLRDARISLDRFGEILGTKGAGDDGNR
jgi:hypothetical protein